MIREDLPSHQHQAYAPGRFAAPSGAFRNAGAGLWKFLSHACTAKVLVGWPPEKSTRETAWLDGLRGVAAFLVMIYHLGLKFYPAWTYEAPFGALDLAPSEEQSEKIYLMDFWRLPILRFWMASGHTQVSVFFVLSGFVLSWGPLSALRKGEMEKFSRSLGSAVFRRWMRLYIPCFAIAFTECLQAYFGLIKIGGVERMSFFAQVWDYLKANARFANPFHINRSGGWDTVHRYDWTMWTIPYEFAGSMLVFLTLLAVSRIRSYRKRTAVLCAVAVSALIMVEWNFWLFATGMLLSNYVINMGGFKELNKGRVSYILWSIIMLVGMLLGGLPSRSKYFTRPGYEWLSTITPDNDWKTIEEGARFWWCWAGIFIVLSASHLPTVRNFFELSLMRYMGRISYMLYLTHRIVLNLVGDPVAKVIYKLLGRKDFLNDTPSDNHVGHALMSTLIYVILVTVLVPLTCLVAHWCEVLVDAPSTRFARWVDDWFTKGGAEAQDEEKEMVSIGLSTSAEERAQEIEERFASQDDSDSHAEEAPLLAGDTGVIRSNV